MAVKKQRKRFGLVIYSYFKDSAFAAVKRDTKLNKFVTEVPFVNRRYAKWVPFLSKMVY